MNDGQKALVGLLLHSFVGFLRRLSTHHQDDDFIPDVTAAAYIHRIIDDENAWLYSWDWIAVAFKNQEKLKVMLGKNAFYVGPDLGSHFVTCYDERVAHLICNNFNKHFRTIRTLFETQFPGYALSQSQAP